MKKLFIYLLFVIAILISSCAKDETTNPVTPTTGTITGKVTNGGASVNGATVTTNPVTSTVTTDTAGNYTITSVAPATYTVTATKTGLGNGITSVNVTAGGTATANISLSLSTGIITGTVTSNGSLVIDATVTTTPATTTVTTNNSGIYTISNVNPATYTVTATKTGLGTGTTSVNVTAGGTATGNITINAMPTAGLVAYYPFNGNANDESGNGNNGTVHGATLAVDRFGNTNRAYSFNGTSNYIDVVDNPILRFNNNFSISLWVSLSSPYRLNYNMTFIGKALGSDYKDSYCIYTGIWTGGDTSVNTGYCNNSACKDNVNNFALNLNTWYNITWSFDKTLNVETLYINGNLIKSQTITGTIEYDNHALTLGNDFSYGIAAEFLAGKLDDIRLYNRALTTTEILQLYHEGGWTK